jgi:hypothetical protein
MKWINAGERMPEDGGSVIFRRVGDKRSIILGSDFSMKLFAVQEINREKMDKGQPLFEIDMSIFEWLDESSTKPDIYALGSSLNTERITKYRKLAEDYYIEEGTVRDIFCRGADWGIEVAERLLGYVKNNNDICNDKK